MSHTSSLTNPMVIFWLGVLTGALVAGFVFMYRALNGADYNNALLKYSSPYSTTSTNLLNSGSLTAPLSIGPSTGY